jgi:hypothetical protein
VTFTDPTAVDKVLKFPVHQLDGKIIEPKVAVPRKTNPKLVSPKLLKAGSRNPVPELAKPGLS